MTQSHHSAVNVTRKDFVVHNLDKVEPAYATFNGTMYAGRLPANNIDAASGVERTGDTMFWMFEPTEQSVPDTLVIWLNGGEEFVLLVVSHCVCGWCAYMIVDTCKQHERCT
jgi:carboxypeptidase C (cathepsin A)